MFRVNFFCEDKKLADALRGLAGLAAGTPEVQPVVNAVHKNGKIAAASGSLPEQFYRYAKAHKIEKFTSKELIVFCKEAGLASSSRGYLLGQLKKAGAIKKHGAGTKSYYTVLA